MKYVLLASAAVLFAASTSASAAYAPTEPKSGYSDVIDISDMEAKRRRGRRARVPGGSGCDSPRDIAEHPECTPTPPPTEPA